MKRSILALVSIPCLVLVSTGLEAARRTVLPDLIQPDAILARNDKLYVLERTSIMIYSLNDLRLLKTFGREGEGPQEFMVQPFGPPMTISFYRDRLVVNSNNKMSFFTLDGRFVSEHKAPPNAVFYRVEGGYLGIGSALGEDNNQYISYRLFDDDFQNPRLLYQSEIMLGRISSILLPMNALNYYPITKDRIFIVRGKLGFVIEAYDHGGRKLFDLRREPEQQLKVPESYRLETLNWFKRHPLFRDQYEQIKEVIRFKTHYPAIKTIAIDSDTLYVITNVSRNGSYEYITLSPDGKERGRGWVPLQEPEPYTYYPLLITVDRGEYHALLEDEEEEVWRLHTQVLKR